MPQPIDNPKEFGLPEDLVAIGGELNSKTLVNAYSSGAFPWPEDDELPILWFSPNPRGILRYNHLHLSRSLKRTLRKNLFEIRIDSAFEQVIDRCQISPRKDQAGTWITPRMKAAYSKLHQEGIAHSVETYYQNRLVGGMYGVYVHNTFSGESMFHSYPDASKVALVTLLQTLNKAGIFWIDTQMLTPVIEALGGELISKSKYMRLLERNRKQSVISWNVIKNNL